MKADNTFTRNVEVLEAIAGAKGGLSFTEIIDTCKRSSRATLARQLKVLLEGQFITQDEFNRYVIGERSTNFARAVLQIVSRADLLQPLVDRLANSLGESIAYMEATADSVQCVAKCEKPESFHFINVNAANRNWLRSPFAIAITAFADSDTAKRYQRFAAEMASTDEHIKSYENNLKRARDKKFPTAPVFTCPGGRVIGAIGIVGFREGTSKSRQKEMIERIHESANEATAIFERHGIDRIIG